MRGSVRSWSLATAVATLVLLIVDIQPARAATHAYGYLQGSGQFAPGLTAGDISPRDWSFSGTATLTGVVNGTPGLHALAFSAYGREDTSAGLVGGAGTMTGDLHGVLSLQGVTVRIGNQWLWTMAGGSPGAMAADCLLLPAPVSLPTETVNSFTLICTLEVHGA